MENPPKVFISYSQTTQEHIAKVMDLAYRLSADGVEVIIDQWDLKEGHDSNYFMESSISESIDKVLLILDKTYVDKANKRKGGVGKETQIISPEVYENTKQEKFIPIIWETDENGNYYKPIYLTSTIHINLSNNEKYEESYERLLRNIHGKPLYPKPSIGKIPSDILDNNPRFDKTKSILQKFEYNLNNNPKKIDNLINEFFEETFNYINTFDISKEDNAYEIGKNICNLINENLQLRDQYITLFEKICKNKLIIDTSNIIEFFEKLHELRFNVNSNKSQHNKFLIDYILRELFLYSIAIPLKNKHYIIIEELFYSSYYLKDYSNEICRFDGLDQRGYIHTNDLLKSYYNKEKNKNFHSPLADLMISNIHFNYKQDDLVDADLLCFYISILHPVCFKRDWFPFLYIYKKGRNINIFMRLTSKKHFENVKGIFNVNTIEELKELLNQPNRSDDRYGYNILKTIKPIRNLIQIEQIGTFR